MNRKKINYFLKALLLSFVILTALSGGFLNCWGQVPPQQIKDDGLHTLAYVDTELVATYPEQSWGSRSAGFIMREGNVYTIIGSNPTVLDVSNKSHPTFVAEYDAPDAWFRNLILREPLLYLGISYGVEILNVSNLNNITKVGEYNTTGVVWQLAIHNDVLYLGANTAGLVILNINDPTNPVELGCYDNNGAV